MTYPAAFAQFEVANPDIAEWWTDTNFEFALSLRDQVMRGKLLSDRQMETAQRCAAQSKARQAARIAAQAAPKVEVNVDLIEKAFSKGQSNGLLRPKMRLLGKDGLAYIISMAPAHGRNAGSLYVKRDEVYMGKITAGAFQRSAACSDADEAVIVEACGNPEHSSVAYGRAFGSCSCCGRELTNALSIELGIGPICRSKFFGY